MMLPRQVWFRACATDAGEDILPERSEWTPRLDRAREVLEGYRDADPPFDDVWLEKAVLSTPERVEELA